MTSWEQLKELGNAEFKKGNYQQAISLYTDAIHINSYQDILYSNRALCYKAIYNYRNALIDLDRALSINPSNVKNIKRKAEVCVIVGNFPEAISLLQKCSNLEPREQQHKTDLIQAGHYLRIQNDVFEEFKKENYTKSEELSKSLINISTGHKEIKIVYIESLINNNKLQEAAHYWTQLSENDRSDDELLYLICKIFYYEGNYDRAKTFVKKLISRVNDNPKYNKLSHILQTIEKDKEIANNLFKNNKYNEAIDAYSHLLSIDPQNKIFNSTIIANRALCYTKINKNIEALDDLNKSLLWNVKYVKGYLRRANLHMKMEDYEQAKYDFNKVIELEPDNSEAKKGFNEAKNKEKHAKKKDYYATLEIPKTADENQIRKAYKLLALKWHPDKNSQNETQKAQAEKKFKEIAEAYAVLSDPNKRKMFDSGVDPNDHENGYPGGSGFESNVDPSEIFKMFFGGGNGFGGFSQQDDDFGGFSGFNGSGGSHPFSQFFSSSGRGGKSQTFTYTFK